MSFNNCQHNIKNHRLFNVLYKKEATSKEATKENKIQMNVKQFEIPKNTTSG